MSMSESCVQTEKNRLHLCCNYSSVHTVITHSYNCVAWIWKLKGALAKHQEVLQVTPLMNAWEGGPFVLIQVCTVCVLLFMKCVCRGVCDSQPVKHDSIPSCFLGSAIFQHAAMTPTVPGYVQMIEFQHPTRGKLYMWFQKVIWLGERKYLTIVSNIAVLHLRMVNDS